jgi:hypothetical protein
MKWQRMSTEIGTDETGTPEYQLGSSVERDTQLSRGLHETSKAFVLGERVDVSIADFNAIAFTCQQFVEQILARLPMLTPARED